MQEVSRRFSMGFSLAVVGKVNGQGADNCNCCCLDAGATFWWNYCRWKDLRIWWGQKFLSRSSVQALEVSLCDWCMISGRRGRTYMNLSSFEIFAIRFLMRTRKLIQLSNFPSNFPSTGEKFPFWDSCEIFWLLLGLSWVWPPVQPKPAKVSLVVWTSVRG